MDNPSWKVSDFVVISSSRTKDGNNGPDPYLVNDLERYIEGISPRTSKGEAGEATADVIFGGFVVDPFPNVHVIYVILSSMTANFTFSIWEVVM